MSDNQTEPERRSPSFGLAIPLSDLAVRAVSALVLVVVALLVTWTGGVFAVLAVILLGLAVLKEWESLTGSTSTRTLLLGLLVLGGAAFAAFALGPLHGASIATALLFGALIASLMESRLRWTLTGLAYATWLVVSLIGLRGHDTGGLSAVLFVFVAVWTTDTAAYFGGRAFGGARMAPSISPNKTWSGAICGVIATVGLCLTYVLLVHGSDSEIALGGESPGLAILLSILLAVFLSGIAQVGDLFESSLKRRFGAKDTGSMLPGHGGFMDRVDGLVFASTAAFLIGLSSTHDGSVASGLLKWGAV